MFTFQRDGSQVFEKDIFLCVLKLARSFFKNLYLKGVEKEFTFSKVNTVKKKKKKEGKCLESGRSLSKV